MASHKNALSGIKSGVSGVMMAAALMLVGAHADAQTTPPSTSSAQADSGDHPQLMPKRDVTVDYEVKPQQTGTAQKVRVYFGADGSRLRVDAPDGAGETILNRTQQQVTVVLNHARVYTQFSPKEGIKNPFLLDISMKFTRQGQSSVAGQTCTQWNIVSGNGSATACVTEDGVILSENGVDSDGLSGELHAVAVNYGPIASTVFDPPSNYQQVAHHPFGGSGRLTTGAASSDAH